MNPTSVESPAGSAEAPLTLFIADDHRIVRDGMRVLAERTGGYRVVGEAADGRALLEGVLAQQPDVVITDMSMGQLNGVEATRQLREGGYTGIVVMFSMHDDRRTLSQALQAGVNAYVHKDHAFDQIMSAIAAARRGELWLSPQLAALADGGAVLTLLEILTPRERDVLQLFAEGHGTKEVAGKLGLSPKTVEVYRLNLYAKLRCNNVIELTRIAIKEGLVQL
jgi:DNA-binding NarL/FixJ family response regulator